MMHSHETQSSPAPWRTALTALTVLTLLSAIASPAFGAPQPHADAGAGAAGGSAAGAGAGPVEANEQPPYLVVTDDLGREVVLMAVPTRVLGLARQFIEELFEIGVTPVGRVDEYGNRPEGVALPSVGAQQSPNIEAILALEPDLILGNPRHHAVLADTFEEMGIPVYFVDPALETDFFTDRTTLFGRLLDRDAEAAAYATHISDVITELRVQVDRCDHRTGLLLQGGGDTVRAAQPTGLYGALFPALGLDNIVPSDLPGAGQSTFVTYDLETITREDPDVILVRAAGSGERDLDRLRAFYTESPLWAGLTAIAEGRIYVLPPKVNPGNIANEDALRTTADLLCPVP